jgi:hypothetical protein
MLVFSTQLCHLYFPLLPLSPSLWSLLPPPPSLCQSTVCTDSEWVGAIEIDTLEYQQTEKIETELKDVDRIRANRSTQLCPGSTSGASHSHNTIYYSFPADSPPSRKEAPRWRVLYRITRQLLHRARCGSFSQSASSQARRTGGPRH